MTYVYTHNSSSFRGKLIKTFESYTMGDVIDFTVEQKAIKRRAGQFIKSVYNIQTDAGIIRVEENSKRGIMRKCLASGGKITFIVWGNLMPAGFTLDPVVNPWGNAILHSNRDPTSLSFVSFKTPGMVENTKDVHWGRVWAFVNGVQVV